MKIQDKIKLMGKIVTVNWTFERRQAWAADRAVKKWEHQFHSKPRAGWVVGFRTIYSGESIPLGPDAGMEWVTKESHLCMLVAYWPSMKFVFVPLNYDGSWKLGGRPAIRSYERGGLYWDDKDKEILRQEMKTWPRDEKGRWIKKSI